MATIDLSPELNRMIEAIATRTVYRGRPISPWIIKQLIIEIRDNGGGILAPAWLSVLERGRGPRKSTKDSGLWMRIYAWMEKNNMFRSLTDKGKINEAKGLTWYINKHGNEQFRNQVYIEVYQKARDECVASVVQKYGELEFQITKDII